MTISPAPAPDEKKVRLLELVSNSVRVCHNSYSVSDFELLNYPEAYKDCIKSDVSRKISDLMRQDGFIEFIERKDVLGGPFHDRTIIEGTCVTLKMADYMEILRLARELARVEG